MKTIGGTPTVLYINQKTKKRGVYKQRKNIEEEREEKKEEEQLDKFTKKQAIKRQSDLDLNSF